jgi:hypothetical protein
MRKIYTKRQFQILCSCSLIGLTLLSLRRLSYSSSPCGPLEGFFHGCTNDDAAGGHRIRKRNSTGGGEETEKENDNDDNIEWWDFVKDYEKRFQRGPPPSGFDAWFQFATKNQCETRRFYESLDADLQYWRNMNNKTSSLLQWDRVIPEAIQWTTK